MNAITLRSLPTRTFALSLVFLLCALPFTLAGDTPAVPLHLSVSVDRSRTVPVIDVTINNASEKDWIVPLGFTYAGRTHPERFRILLTVANGTPATVLYRRVSFISGRVDPSFTTLLRGSTYSFRLPTDDYVVNETNQLLNELVGHGAIVQVQYRADEGSCPRTLDGRNRPLLSCWTGVLTSNAMSY